ncbi:helix-turn-helix domain-containing protein [Promicromonospora sp. Marseille-Q5078]
MTQPDTTADSPVGGRPTVRYRGRHLPMVAVVVAAFIATALAYSGMVLFGLEVAHMSPAEAYALAGFLEVSLVAVALMARNAALEGRPYGVLLTLTWILSGTSGMFAALHEIAVPDASTPYMVAFRFVPPLVAALMWHLALVGERHLVTGHTLDERRREHRVHQYVTALELWRDARLDSAGTRQGARKVRAAHQRQRAARDGALKLLTVEDFERRMQVWVERLEAAERHGNRLDLIGASSVERGVSRGRAVGPGRAVPALAAEPAVVATPATTTTELAEPAVPAEPDVTPATDEQPAVTASFEDEFQAALTGGTPVVRSAEHEPERAPAPVGLVDDASEDRADEASTAEAAVVAAAEAGLPGTREPLPETGHTRRVEVFDLLRQADPALGGALAQRSAFLTSHGDSPEASAEVATVSAPEPEAAPEPAADVALDVAPPDVAAPDDQPTSDRDRWIVELAGDGLNQREIAQRVDVSRATVSRVMRRYATA